MTPWRTIRIFISSTFHDMHAERDWLVRFVFPKLREELLPHRIHLVDVDLRWGVTSEPLEACCRIVDECRPRFLCMLGGRYGSVMAATNRSITADEVHYAVLDRASDERGFSFFYFRDPEATASIVEEVPGEFRDPDGSDAANQLITFKQAITDSGLPVFIYPATWDDAQRRLAGLSDFGNRVYADLFQSLKDDPELASNFKGTDEDETDPILREFATEAEQIDAFIEERNGRYVPGSRESVLEEISTFATSQPTSGDEIPNIFVITGEPGSGKSALLARFVSDLPPFPCLVIRHFVGASFGSTDLRRTLRRLCHELAPADSTNEPLPLDTKDLITRFQMLLDVVSATQRVILVFDALDQFDATDGAHWLNWLPREMPAGVRIIASVISRANGEEEHRTLAILRNRKDTRIENLKPLTEADILAITESYLQRYAKRLTPEQLSALLAKPAGRLPLYIITALDELRTLGAYEITDRIAELPGDARGLFGWILTERLASDPGLSSHPGGSAALVQKFAASLGVSRHGLSQAEFAALLDPGDPRGNVAALLRLLRPYLMRRGELIDFYHGQFRAAVETAYLQTTEKLRTAHRSVATCLQAFADPHGDGQYLGATSHALSELPHHQICAENWPDLIVTLENIFFLEAKVAKGMAFDLGEDFTVAVNAIPPAYPNRGRMRLLNEALRRDLHFIARHATEYPQGLFQCLWNSAWWYDCPEAAAHYSISEGDLSPPWESPNTDFKLATLLESWRRKRELSQPNFFWLRALRPPRTHLNAGLAAVLEGHGDHVGGVAFSPDGRRVASAADDRTVRTWDSLSGQQLTTIKMEKEGFLSPCLAFSPDGSLLIIGNGRNVELWHGESAQLLRIFHGHAREVTRVEFSSDGKLALSSALDRTLRVWSIEDAQELAVLGGHDPDGSGGVFSGDASRVIYSAEETVHIVETRSGRELATLKGHDEIVTSLVISPDGQWIVSGCIDNSICIWDLNSGKQVAKLLEHKYAIISLAISPDNRLIASGSTDNTVRLWDIESRLCVAVFVGHESTVMSVSFSPDGLLLASASWDRTVRLWHADSSGVQFEPHQHKDFLGCISAAHRGDRVASCSRDGTAIIWDAKSGYPKAFLRHGPGDRSVGCVAFSHDDRILVTSAENNNVRDWADQITVRLWNSLTGKELAVLDGHEDSVNDVAFSPDDRKLASASGGSRSGADNNVRVWDTASGHELAVLRGHESSVECVAFSPDGLILASGSYDKSVRLWDAASGSVLAILHGHSSIVWCVEFSPDGRLLVSASADRSVRIWDGRVGRELVAMDGHKDQVKELAFSPDGNRLFSRSLDGEVREWSLRNFACLQVLVGTRDLKALAKGAIDSPYQAILIDDEISIQEATCGAIVAWGVGSQPLTSILDGKTWATRSDGCLSMVRLEGGAGCGEAAIGKS